MEKFKIEMTKDEMIRYYANKIVEDGIKDTWECNSIINMNDYGDVVKYKDEILDCIYRDERVADVSLDDEGNFDMIFYTDYCPFYYDDKENMEYNDITDNPIFQANVLDEFTSYIQSRVFEESYISTRILINDFLYKNQGSQEYKCKLANFLKKSIIETGFVDKYIENISVYVTTRNHKELETALLDKIKQLECKEKTEDEEEME